MTAINDPPKDATCACDCECDRALTPGNAMGEDITDRDAKPWEKAGPDAPRIVLLICADCYIGNHRRAT